MESRVEEEFIPSPIDTLLRLFLGIGLMCLGASIGVMLFDQLTREEEETCERYVLLLQVGDSTQA